MKKSIYFLSFFYVSILLAGCISIPFGDNVLEISTDGIEFVDNQEGDEPGEQEVMEELRAEEEIDLSEEVSSDLEVKDGNSDSDSEEPKNSCEEQDHSTVTDDLVPDFFIPDCALLTNVSKDSNGLDAYFTVKGGDWQEIFKAYKEFFGDFLNQERQNPASQDAELSATLYDNPDDYTIIQINQGDEEVSLRIIQRFTEEE